MNLLVHQNAYYSRQEKRRLAPSFFFNLLLKRGKESVRYFKGGYYERDRTGKIVILHSKYTALMCKEFVPSM